MTKIKECSGSRGLAILQPHLTSLQYFTGYEDFLAVCLDWQ